MKSGKGGTSFERDALEKITRKVRREPWRKNVVGKLLDQKMSELRQAGKVDLPGDIQERAESLVLNFKADDICFNEIHGLQM